MSKVDTKFIPNGCQRPVCSVHQCIIGYVIRWSEPFSFEYSPKGFRDVEVWTIRRKEEEEQPSFFPNLAKFSHHPAPVNFCVVKENERISPNMKGKPIQEVSYFVGRNTFCDSESVVMVIPVNHPEQVQSCPLLGRNAHVLPTELPAVRDITFRADVAFIPVVKVNEPFLPLSFKFLQLLDLVRIELRRGFPLGTFSYTSISCANADKKLLKVLSLAALPEACRQASLAFFTLCLSFSMAARTASSSEQSMTGFRPRPGRVFKPDIPSASKRFTQEFTEMCVISVCRPTSLEGKPWDFNRMARQRIRKQWLSPFRKPSSNCRRDSSVNDMVLIFAIIVQFYNNVQRYKLIMIYTNFQHLLN